MKKQKAAGDNISLKTKKNEPQAILDWINSQTNLMDSIRFLIENDIRQHGVRNLQHFVPADRNFEGGGAAYAALTAHAQEAAAGLQSHGADFPLAEAKREEPEPDPEIDDEDIESWM